MWSQIDFFLLYLQNGLTNIRLFFQNKRMKIKKIWLTVFLFALFYSGKAENNHVHFMLFGGFNSSKTITELAGSRETFFSEAKLNYNFGIALRFEFANILFIQPEVYFTRKGGLTNAFRTSLTDTFNQQEVSAHSIDFPIMFGLRLFHSDAFCLRFYGGPVVSYLIDQNVDVNKNGQQITFGDIRTGTHAFSAQVGAGIDIRRFTFDVRYEYGLSPMHRHSDFRTRYRLISFTLGIKLF